MRPKEYPALERAIDTGVRFGHNRAFKHDRIPSAEGVILAIIEAVLNVVREVFEFEDREEGDL